MKNPGQGFARRVTMRTLETFRRYLEERGGGPSHPRHSEAEADEEEKVEDSEAASLFGGKHIEVKRPFGARSPGKPRSKETRFRSVGMATKGELAWQKKLSVTDAQRQVGNPTGDLRLTQAGFKVRDVVIDQTTYFREVVFGNGSWAVESSRVEVAQFDFDCTVLGRHYGVHRLWVSHKPTGEAGQGNYTSGIRWGSMLRTLAEEVNVSGAMFRLYSPLTAEDRPFVIDIRREGN